MRPKLVSKKRTSGSRSNRSSIRSMRTRQCYRNLSGRFAILPRTLSGSLEFRYIAIDGAVGVSMSSLADRLGERIDATFVVDVTGSPFFADFYGVRPGAAFQAQLFYTLSRHWQQTALRQSDLFS